MVATVNITPTPITEGTLYASNVPITTTEAALGDGVQVTPIIPVIEGQTVVAVVKLIVNGLISGGNAYVVMQTDLGDGTWIDVAWIVSTIAQGSVTFVLCGGGLGAMNNAFAQSRQQGAFPTPQAAGSNAVPLGGRVRFVGRATQISSSSTVGGVPSSANVLATIFYKLQHPR